MPAMLSPHRMKKHRAQGALLQERAMDEKL